VPELNDPQLREIPAYSWRIIYRLREGNVYIVTLIQNTDSLALQISRRTTSRRTTDVSGIDHGTGVLGL
jgi:hypothetical protein